MLLLLRPITVIGCWHCPHPVDSRPCDTWTHCPSVVSPAACVSVLLWLLVLGRQVAITGHAELPPRADPLQKKAEKLARAMARKEAAATAAALAAKSNGRKLVGIKKGGAITAGAPAAGAGAVVKAAPGANGGAPGVPGKGAAAIISGGFDPARRLHRTKVPMTRVVSGRVSGCRVLGVVGIGWRCGCAGVGKCVFGSALDRGC